MGTQATAPGWSRGRLLMMVITISSLVILFFVFRAIDMAWITWVIVIVVGIFLVAQRHAASRRIQAAREKGAPPSGGQRQ